MASNEPAFTIRSQTGEEFGVFVPDATWHKLFAAMAMPEMIRFCYQRSREPQARISGPTTSSGNELVAIESRRLAGALIAELEKDE